MSVTERPVSAALKSMLVNNEPFQYAHLIKFERPSLPDAISGEVSTSKQRYTYLTDASRDVIFDDGSVDLVGVANGPQTYLANKVLSVGAFSEQTKATQSTTSVVLDGNALGAMTPASSVTITLITTGVWDIAFPTTVDPVSLGFREGDKVQLTYSSFSYKANIQGFREGNIVRVTKVDDTLTTGSYSLTMSLSSEEIVSILLNKTASDYASFINREVFIYRAYFQNGSIVGTPVPMFKGIIYSNSFEDSETAIKVTWGLTSHWGDFAQVKGRLTSDDFHRALDSNGVPQPLSALKVQYAYDKGFSHAETSINMLATYTVMVEKIDVKAKSGVFGIGAKTKVKKYFVPEDRHTNLDFELSAKSIPVVYGVRNVQGLNVFADTLKDDSATVYVATALCEGEIGGIYDVYIEGNSLICNDKADYDARATQTSDNTVQLICRGRADRGDTLGGTVSTTSSTYTFYSPTGEQISLSNINYISLYGMSTYSPPTPDAPASTDGKGIIDGQSIKLTSPQEIVLDVFSGKPGQRASAQLSEVAYNKNFKIQTSYWTGADTTEYWGPNHRLLDTAYIVGKYKIAEGETTIPEISYIVRGKVINCYNYDYSFKHDSKVTGESPDNFLLGEVVSLYYMNGAVETLLNSNVRIIDKWKFNNPDGTYNYRFRFSTPPALAYNADGNPTISKFYMKDASNNIWTMTTHNYVYPEASGSVPGVISADITSSSQITNSSGKILFTYSTNSYMPVENDPVDTSPGYLLLDSSYNVLTTTNLFRYAVLKGTATSTAFTCSYNYADYTTEISALTYPMKLASKNTIRLPVGASSTTDYYKGDMLEVSRIDATTGKTITQSAEIIGYDGTLKIATVDSLWDFIPKAGDTIKVYPKYADSRVSTNPAIQTMDYITSKTYGRGLDYIKDLYLPSWLETARKCDTQSDVTVLLATGTPAVGDEYKYTNGSGNIIFQGTVLSTQGLYVTFTNVIGKLTNKWNAWKSWNVDEVIYNTAGSLFKVTTAGVYATEPTSGSIPAGLQALSSLPLTRVSGSGSVSLTANIVSGNPIQSSRNGQKISGYSIYDCDDVNYWRLAGWDEHAQRYATKAQCNLVIDTSAPLFDNINSLLEHYNGILRYTAGKYYLDIEELAGTIASNDIRTITADDIIGKIQLTDEGVRSAFNSLTAAFADPANKFEARSISFFNSTYLKEDRNVPKKGNLSIPGITNYYNTRLLADSFLNKSRYGLTINLTVRYHGLLFLAGTVIQLVYPRYSWVNKKFRIEALNYQPDGLVDIVAKEYDDSFYSLSNIKKSAGTGATTNPGVVLYPEGRGPINLTATTDKYNQIVLTWDNGATAGLQSTYVEIWRADTDNFNAASVIAMLPVTISGATTTQQYIDSIAPTAGGVSSIDKYYWVRHKVIQ